MHHLTKMGGRKVAFPIKSYKLPDLLRPQDAKAEGGLQWSAFVRISKKQSSPENGVALNPGSCLLQCLCRKLRGVRQGHESPKAQSHLHQLTTECRNIPHYTHGWPPYRRPSALLFSNVQLPVMAFCTTFQLFGLLDLYHPSRGIAKSGQIPVTASYRLSDYQFCWQDFHLLFFAEHYMMYVWFIVKAEVIFCARSW